jgi:hypothetical protein
MRCTPPTRRPLSSQRSNNHTATAAENPRRTGHPPRACCPSSSITTTRTGHTARSNSHHLKPSTATGQSPHHAKCSGATASADSSTNTATPREATLRTYMEGAGRVDGGGRAGRVREGWPEPISARAGAAQEVWLGLSRRLIPRPGQDRLPGALGARRKLSPIVWAFAVRTLLEFRLLRLRAGRGSCGARSCARR